MHFVCIGDIHGYHTSLSFHPPRKLEHKILDTLIPRQFVGEFDGKLPYLVNDTHLVSLLG